MGTGRYLIAAFPAFALAGERCSELRWGRWALALGGVVMVALSMGFSRSWYLT
jgi:hypothetical protein